MRSLTIKLKLLAIIGLVMASLMIAGAMSLVIIQRVKVGGPVYVQIVQGKDLIADVLPPPSFLIESYLNTFEMVNASINTDKDPKGLDTQMARWTELATSYQQRLAYWKNQGLDADINDILLNEVDPPAQRFLELGSTKLLAALKAGEFEAINELVFETMKKEYDQHKAAIDRLVALTNLRNEDRATAAARTVTLGLTTMVSTGTVLLIIAASIIWMVATGINRSLGRTVAVLDAMAGGDTSRRLEVRGTDEIAQLSHAVNRTVDNMNGVITAVTAKAESLAGKGRDLDAASRSLISDAERTVGEVRGAATAADQVSANTGNAATNTDELRQAITKIAESVNNLSGMVETGNQRANAARDIITKLDASSREVGQVVKLISRIAEQTNTLALNATIQAAAAGEAGRGFLVVANEVKDLAKKTADATTQVSGSIVRIQKDTADAVGAIGEVAGTINEITAFQQSVAAAITEQSATTDVLAGTVQDVAEQAAAIAGTVRQVNAVAEQTGQAAAAVGRTAAEITIIAGELATISEAKVTT